VVVGTLVLIGAVVLLTYVVFGRYRRAIEQWYRRGERTRQAVTAVFLVAVAWTFIRSGDGLLILIAIGAIASATIYVLIEEPHKEIR